MSTDSKMRQVLNQRATGDSGWTSVSVSQDSKEPSE